MKSIRGKVDNIQYVSAGEHPLGSKPTTVKLNTIEVTLDGVTYRSVENPKTFLEDGSVADSLQVMFAGFAEILFDDNNDDKFTKLTVVKA